MGQGGGGWDLPNRRRSATKVQVEARWLMTFGETRGRGGRSHPARGVASEGGNPSTRGLPPPGLPGGARGALGRWWEGVARS